MCTLVVQRVPGSARPLVLLANRDERLDRPADGWRLRTTPRGTRILAPRDLTAGGTWIGVNAHGLLVALTNHNTGRPPDPARRSRGVLVDDLLDCATAADALAATAGHAAHAYNPFHLVVADAREAHLWHTDGLLDERLALPPGIHVVTESDALGRAPRAASVRRLWRDPVDAASAHALLATHDDDPRVAVCMHLGTTYGTRSSAFLSLGHARPELFVVDAPPCQAAFTDLSSSLRALLSG